MCSQGRSSLFSLGVSSMENWLDETWQTLLRVGVARRGTRWLFHVELRESFSFFPFPFLFPILSFHEAQLGM
jgi:hypothetical protein